jgi:hypothetical protein
MPGAAVTGGAGRTAATTAAGAAAAYLVFFLILFAQFPLRGTLPGNTDTWLVGIAIPNTIRSQIGAWLAGGAPPGQWLFPAAHPLLHGETALGTGLLFALMRTLMPGDVVAYYLFISLIFAGSSWGLFLLARDYLGDARAACLAGFGFGVANYTLANIDSPHTSFWGLAFVALLLLRRYLAGAPSRFLYCGAALGGLQVWFSAYVFLFASLWALLLVLLGIRHLSRRPGVVRPLAVAAAIHVLISAPFFITYLGAMDDAGFVKPVDHPLFAASCSLGPADLVRALPGNLIYPEGPPLTGRDIGALRREFARLGRDPGLFDDPDTRMIMGPGSPVSLEAHWPSVRRRAHIGLGLYALAIAGLIGCWRAGAGAIAPGAGSGRSTALELGLVGALGLVLALGPVVMLWGRAYPTLLFPLYDHFSAVRLFRVPVRAFALTVASVSIAAGYGWLCLLRQWERVPRPRLRPIAWLAIALLVVGVENIPFPMPAFAAAPYAAPSPDYVDFLSGLARSGPGRETAPAAERIPVILDLPSAIGYGGALVGDLFPQNRELIYMNWQTYHRQNIVNGLNGYLPRSRVEMQKAIDALPDPAALAMLRRLGVRYLALHPNLALDGAELRMLAAVRRAPSVRLVYAARGLVVLRLEPESDDAP